MDNKRLIWSGLLALVALLTAYRIYASVPSTFAPQYQQATDDAQIEALKAVILKPLDMFEEHKGATTDPTVNPHYIRPTQFMYRLQKIMDEYAGGVSSQFSTNDKLLEKGLELLGMLKEDSENLAANGLHELMRSWEAQHRMYQGEAHVRSVLFREETRWPGYYFRADKPSMDNENWLAFCNCKYDRNTGDWEMIKRPVKYITQ